MDIALVKRTIVEQDEVSNILQQIGCHEIEFHSGNPDNFYTCANKDGDNRSAITVYLNENLKTIKSIPKKLNDKIPYLELPKSKALAEIIRPTFHERK